MSGQEPRQGEPLLGDKGRGLVAGLRDWRIGALLFSDDGRIGRRALWIYFLCVMALAFAVFFSKSLRPMPAVHLAFGLLLLFPSYCVFAKRLQDIAIPGGWAIAMITISAIDAMLSFSGWKARPGRFALAAEVWSWIGLLNLGVFVVLLGCWPGTNGANRFGLRWPPW